MTKTTIVKRMIAETKKTCGRFPAALVDRDGRQMYTNGAYVIALSGVVPGVPDISHTDPAAGWLGSGDYKRLFDEADGAEAITPPTLAELKSLTKGCSDIIVPVRVGGWLYNAKWLMWLCELLPCATVYQTKTDKWHKYPALILSDEVGGMAYLLPMRG